MKFTTAAEAWAYSFKNEDITDPKCAGRQFEAMELLADLARKHAAGDAAALVYAMGTCARHGLAMPGWLAEAVSEGVTRWHNFEARSLDEALTVSRKGKRAADELSYRRNRNDVLRAVLDLVERGAPIDDGLFDGAVASIEMDFQRGQRAAPPSFSGGTCKRWFYKYIDESEPARIAFDYVKARKQQFQ